MNIKIDQLHLDNQNPRLPEEKQGKPEPEILSTLYQDFFLDELADSMSRNGYFDEEPLVAIPQKLPKKLHKVNPHSRDFMAFVKKSSAEFTVVEGNRRLATAKLLLNADQRERLRIKNWPSLSDAIADDLRILPVIVYRTRDEIVPYLGVRHIVGIHKSGIPNAKARYIAMMVEHGGSINVVGELMGMSKG